MQNPSGGIPLQTLQGIEPENVQEGLKSYNPTIIHVRNQVKRIEQVISTNSIPILKLPKFRNLIKFNFGATKEANQHKSAFPVPDTMLAGEGVKVMLTNKCPS